MAADNKIMTVSYGTFSCTLEGFDDPFGTMKEMAEYFRDLAAQDRFFGAEPPQPDVDILHRIAERTGQHQITSEASENNLTLRQAEPADTLDHEDAPDDAAPTPEPKQPEKEKAEPAAPLASTVAAVAAAAVETTDTPNSLNSVAEKLRRIRSAETRDRSGDTMAPTDYSEDEHAAETVSRAPVAEVPETSAEQANHEEATQVDLGSDTTSATDIPEPEVSGDPSKADEPQTIISKSTSATEETEFANEAAPYEAPTEVPAPQSVGFAAHDDADGIEDIFEDEEIFEESVFDDDIDDAEIIVDTAAAEPEIADDVEPAAQALSSEAEEALQKELADAIETPEKIAEESASETIKAAKDDVHGSHESFTDFAQSFASTDDDETSDFTFNDFEGVSQAAAVKPDVQQPADSVVETTADAPKTDEADEDGTLGETADLGSALAARAAKQARRNAMTEDEDAALERLMSATSSRLDDSEGTVRRASIAHLKAAVAATKADSSLVSNAAEKEEAELDRYREDLARVVLPGAKSAETGEAKNVPNQPSPLVLVSAQRIDEATESDPSDEAVRPRRVAVSAISEVGDTTQDPTSSVQKMADDVAVFEDDTNIFADADAETFSAYVDRHKANQLPDLLEAAAAHFSFVEGVSQFTRPMLMRKISSIAPEHDVSREDGLRSFGTLLREGKIVKDEDGKFVISGNSRFLAEARYAGE